MTPLVLAHRATMGHAPENTLLGIRRGIELGADGIEVDVRLSADGVPLLLHDAELDRTTNGSGAVAAHTAIDLQALDAGEGEPVPTLAEALSAVAGKALLVVELKVDGDDEAEPLVAAALEAIEAAHAVRGSWCWSFSPAVLEALARRQTAVPIAHLCDELIPEVLARAERLNLPGVAVQRAAVDAESVAAIRAHGREAFVWTVNAAADIARLGRLPLSGIVSDYPDRVLKELREIEEGSAK